MEDLVKEWGFDSSTEEMIVTIPKLINAQEISNALTPYYSPNAFRQGLDIVTIFRFNIEANGELSNCIQTNGVEGRAYAMPACKVLLERGQFAPARTEGEQSVRSYLVLPITFGIDR